MTQTQTFPRYSAVMASSGVDWNEVWNFRMRSHRSCWEKLGVVSGSISARSARNYWDMVHTTQQERLARILQELEIGPRSRVLDIGSGPGVLALPLAKIVEQVTAVDSSRAMISILSERAAQEGVDNIVCLNKKWEDIDREKDLIPPYDLAVASLSLDMLDIRGCLEKIIAAVSGKIYLYWFAGETGWEIRRRELFHLLHGIEYIPLPKSDVVFNLLYQMGVYPHLQVFPFMHVDGFSSMDEALEHFIQNYRVSGVEQIAVLHQYLRDHLALENGGFRLYSPAVCMKMWWRSSGV